MNKINKSILFFKLCISTIFTINLSASVGNCMELQAKTCHECFCQLKEITDKDTLLVIDCNDVLVSCDRIFYYEYYLNRDAKFIQRFSASDLNMKLMTDIIGTRNGWNEVLNDLSQQGTKIITITPSLSINEDFIKYKVSSMKDFGFKFDALIPNCMSSRIVFNNGILFSGQVNKGKILRNFLQHYYQQKDHLNFKRLVFIDDVYKNISLVQDFQSVFDDLNIELYSIEFLVTRNFYTYKLRKIFGDDKEKLARYEKLAIDFPNCLDRILLKKLSANEIVDCANHDNLLTIKEEEEANEQEKENQEDNSEEKSSDNNSESSNASSESSVVFI